MNISVRKGRNKVLNVLEKIEIMETKPEPKYKIGDIVYLRFSDRPMKIIGRCYDEHWRYKVESLEDSEYWYYEKDFKTMEE